MPVKSVFRHREGALPRRNSSTYSAEIAFCVSSVSEGDFPHISKWMPDPAINAFRRHPNPR